MYENLLQKIGLTENESKVYLALLRIGKSKSGRIVKEASVSGGKIYETLYRLIDKGLVKIVTENGVKHFIANDPHTLSLYVNEKQEELKEQTKELEGMIPKLSGLKIKEELESVSLIKGLRGVRELMHGLLKAKKRIEIMGVTSGKDPRYNNFWRGWHTERVKLRKRARILFSDKNTDYWSHFRRQKYTEVREIIHFTPSAMIVVDDNALIFHYGEEIKCIHIQSGAIADSFSAFFEDLWAFAGK